jgi:hypothetical protein
LPEAVTRPASIVRFTSPGVRTTSAVAPLVTLALESTVVSVPAVCVVKAVAEAGRTNWTK